MKYIPIYLIPLIGFLILFGSCNQTKTESPFWNEESNPETVGAMIVDDLLSRTEIMRYETDFLSTVHYAEAISGMGAVEFLEYADDSSRLRLLYNRYEETLNQFQDLPAGHVDANVVGVLPLQFYLQGGNEEFREMGLKMANQQWENPGEDGLTNQSRYWVDDLYMIAILQKKAFEVTNDSVYINRAAHQFAAYLQRLQQPNGLFHHGEEAPFFWGRGNGWVAVALAEILEVLPEENPNFQIILSSYQSMMETLLKHQNENGMWKQLVNVRESWDETSATAMFGYAMKLGVDKDFLSGKDFTKSYQKAWLALADRLNEKGQLPDICVGTGKSDEIQYYLDRPTVTGDLHGQAPMLWFAHSLLQ